MLALCVCVSGLQLQLSFVNKLPALFSPPLSLFQKCGGEKKALKSTFQGTHLHKRWLSSVAPSSSPSSSQSHSAPERLQLRAEGGDPTLISGVGPVAKYNPFNPRIPQGFTQWLHPGLGKSLWSPHGSEPSPQELVLPHRDRVGDIQPKVESKMTEVGPVHQLQVGIKFKHQDGWIGAWFTLGLVEMS